MLSIRPDKSLSVEIVSFLEPGPIGAILSQPAFRQWITIIRSKGIDQIEAFLQIGFVCQIPEIVISKLQGDQVIPPDGLMGCLT